MPPFHSRFSITATAMAGAIASVSPAQAGRYEFFPIDIPNATSPAGTHVNDKAEVTGVANDINGNIESFIWTPDSITVSPNSIADFSGINDRQFAAGYAGAAPTYTGVIYDLKSKTSFPVATAKNTSIFVSGINATNTVVGTSTNTVTQVSTAFAQHGPKVVYLTPPKASQSEANLLNDSGLVVGDYLPSGKSTYKTFSYFNGKFSDLSVPGPVFALSNDGTVGGQYPSNKG